MCFDGNAHSVLRMLLIRINMNSIYRQFKRMLADFFWMLFRTGKKSLPMPCWEWLGGKAVYLMINTASGYSTRRRADNVKFDDVSPEPV